LLHDVDAYFNALNVFVTLDDEIGLTEFISVLTKVGDLVLEGSKLIEDVIKLLFSGGRSALVLVEFSLLHVLGELSNRLLKLLDVASVLFLLMSDERLNLFGDFLGDLLKFKPVLANLGKLLNLVVLNQFLSMEELDSLIKLIDLQSDAVLFVLDGLGVFHDAEENFDILKIFLSIFSVDAALVISKACRKSFELLSDVFLHNWTIHDVALGICVFDGSSLVWATSEGGHVEFIVLE